ncbi:MAG TPA: Ig-like domain-containing protein [Gemmatimonadaceae bacterium]|nr:Ig-like domain-containing protein [Gemmatimonadaceae bacterium]
MRISKIARDLLVIAATVACAAATPTTPTTPGGDPPPSAPPPPPPPAPPAPPPSPNKIAKASGDAQHGTLAATLASPLVVTVSTSAGVAVSGATVTWSAASGNGTLSATSTTTDASGHASVRWTIDGTYLATSVSAAIAGATVTFTALGNGSGDLGGRAIFPAGNPWRTDISGAPRDANSDSLIANCGAAKGLHPDFGTVYAGAPNGISYVVVHGTQAKVPVSFYYGDESDPGPYPVPPYAPIEGGASSTGDRHVLVIDADNWKLYEMFDAHPVSGGASWTGGSGAIFDMTAGTVRPAGWTSADAAGLPILPGLVRYDEVALRHAIEHAMRFSCARSRKAYIPPARHSAGSQTSANYGPMGMRVRLKQSFDISSFSAANKVILTALKKYGMFLADNGSDMYLSGAPDPRWSDDDLHNLTKVHGSDFEVVQMSGMVTQP